VEQSHLALPSRRGRVAISAAAVAQIAGHTAAECYGVVGMSPRASARLRRLRPRNRITRGIVVSAEDDGVALDLHVVIEHGLNLAEVAGTIRSQVGYEVERLTGLRVASIDVHIEGVRRSA
jgi:uncharacterized alkaline shock family protein YloU